ncbi:MAG: cytochrome c maturation protein CcmE [Fimbriimonadaceae bacterium]|nr:cytochrome c maturation protein CcmE [Fimbriimonadaceae bacterium]
MKPGIIVSIALAAVGVVGLGMVFVSNASPYVTVKEAQNHGAGVHVVGEIVPETLQEKTLDRQVKFNLKDATGTMPVVYTGPPQSNLASAKQVVVIGTMKEGTFHSEKMLVKCPSKYESELPAGSGPTKE